MSALILIAEPDGDLSELLDAHLRRSGFRTAHAADGEAAADLHASLKPDFVLLDVMMPGRDGWDVLGELRRRGDTPVIMLSDTEGERDKLQALRIGADDYIGKPFNPVEVVARVHAILRRGTGANDARIIRLGLLEIDQDSYIVNVIGLQGRRRLSLTLTEFRILAHMAKFPMRAFTRGDLTDACLPRDTVQERTVDSHLSKLRKKLEASGAGGILVSVRGVGYRLEPGEGSD